MKRNKSKMSCKRGFTLIELLVVVLIIGILAAVAVPQYQKAVEKSHAAEALTVIKAIVPAIEEYILTTGEFPSSFDELSVVPAGTLSTYRVEHDKVKGDNYSYILVKGRLDVGSSRGYVPFLWFSPFSQDWQALGIKSRLYCYYVVEDTDEVKKKREAICRSFGSGEPKTASGGNMPGTVLFPLD